MEIFWRPEYKALCRWWWISFNFNFLSLFWKWGIFWTQKNGTKSS